MKKHESILVCALATSEFTMPGSVFDRHCADCGERLMIAREGIAILSKYPGTKSICEGCAAVRLKQRQRPITFALPTLEEIERANREAIPNFWRKRN